MRTLFAGLLAGLIIAGLCGCSSSEEGEATADGSAPPAAMPEGGMPGDAGAAAGNPGGAMPEGGLPDGGMPAGGLPGGEAGIVPREVAEAGNPGGGLPGSEGLPSGGVLPDGTAADAGNPGGIPGAEGGLPGDVAGVGMPGGQAAPVPTTYDGFAKQAFSQGRDRDALKFLQAWALTNEAGAAEVLPGFRWVPALRHPAMAVRWGVALQLTIPPGFSGDVKAIGSQQTLGSRQTRRGGRDGGGGAGGGADAVAGAGMDTSSGAGSNNSLVTYAGDLGRAILDQFQTRVAEGSFGAAFQNAVSGGSTGAGSAGGLAGGGIPGMEGAMPDGGGLPGNPGMPAAGGGGGVRGGGLGRNAIVPITPGMVLVGTGNGAAAEKELIEKAVKEQVDVLAIFKVKVAPNRVGIVQNEVEIKLLDPYRKEELFRSGSLNNIEVQKARELNKDDGVEKEVTKLFDFVDKQLTMVDLPRILTPQLVKERRVDAQLLSGTLDDPLGVLTEILFYYKAKLLTEEDTVSALTRLVGDENAKTLLTGSEEDRKKVIARFVPKT